VELVFKTLHYNKPILVLQNIPFFLLR